VKLKQKFKYSSQINTQRVIPQTLSSLFPLPTW
jgi:hypothetical protein